jgi:hypothetical protein
MLINIIKTTSINLEVVFIKRKKREVISMELKNLQTNDLILIILYNQICKNEFMHYEKISVEAFNINKERFKWKNYDYPEKENIGRCCRYLKEKGVLSSDNNGSYSLTANAHHRILELLDDNKDHKPICTKKHIERNVIVPDIFIDLSIIKNSSVFKRFLHREYNTTKQSTFCELINVSSTVPRRIVQKKLNDIKRKAKEVNDSSVIKFIDKCEIKFLPLFVEY